jgi:hypothetical protein
MKGVSDIFISKDKLALFWFFVACACIVATALHLHTVALDGRSRMLYVAIDQPIIDRLVTPDERRDIMEYQARLAMETYLNRGPRGPLTAERLQKLFVGEGFEAVLKDLQDNSYDFRNREVHQLAEIGAIQILDNDDGTSSMDLSGQVVRVSIDPVERQVVNQSFSLTAKMSWARNTNLRDVKRFPFVCTGVSYLLNENRSQ